MEPDPLRLPLLEALDQIIEPKRPSDKCPWEGPYVVTQVLRLGTYKLGTVDNRLITNA